MVDISFIRPSTMIEHENPIMKHGEPLELNMPNDCI